MEKVPAELMKEYVDSQKFTSTTEILTAQSETAESAATDES